MMPAAPELTDRRNDRRIAFAVCLALTVLVWLVFSQTLGHDFINFDDDRYVYENAEVSRGLTLEGFKWLLTHSHASLWHPLTTLSHMIDCQTYGLRPAGHHFTNVLLHNVGAVLLFLALSQLTGSVWRSAFVAAIFAIHPMHVESVAWVAERKDVLSGVFFALTLGAYTRYARAPSVARYVMMSIFVACGLMSKATFVTVPFVLLLLDYWPLERWHGAGSKEHRAQTSSASTSKHLNVSTSLARGLVLEKIPLLILSAGAAAATIFVQTVTMATLEQLPLLARIKNAVVSLVAYLRQMFWPSDLAIFYPHPHDQLHLGVVLACAALVIAITLFAIFLRKKYPYIFVGWFWYLVLVAPVLGIFQAGLQARADRFTYLPHIGITIAVTWTVAALAQQSRQRRAVLATVISFIIVACAIISWKQATYWRDSISVWERALAVTSNNQVAHQDLAAALWSHGRIVESRIHSRAAEIIHAKTTLQDYPFDIQTRDNLGVLLVKAGDAADAVQQWNTNLQIDPNDGNALNNLAWVLATYPGDEVRDGKRAVELAEKASTLPGGESPIVLRTLAAAYAESGDFAKAINTAQRAVELARGQGNNSLVETLRHEIELYQMGTAYREKPTE
jgi:tetratricopeptide (TPR) repeat protein